MAPPSVYAQLALAVVLVSTSGPFLVMAHMNAYAVAFWRMAASGLLFLAWAWLTRARRGAEQRLTRAHLRPLVVGALCLAAHFCLWIKAFDLTDYASNHLLLVMQPVIAAFLGIRLGEHPTRRTWWSLLIAVAGLVIIARGDFELGPRALVGDLLCILADLAIASFYLVARVPRAELPLSLFMGVTLTVGALPVLALVGGAGVSLLGYPARSFAWLSGIVVLTTLGGHGLMNLAAPHLRLFTLNVVILFEPVLGILFGALLFAAGITWPQIAGGALLSVGVVVGLSGERGAPGRMERPPNPF